MVVVVGAVSSAAAVDGEGFQNGGGADVAELIAAAAPDAPLAEPEVSRGVLVAESRDEAISVELPVEGGGLSLSDSSTGIEVGVGLPEETSTGRPEVADDGTVVYRADPGSGVDVAAQVVEDGSVRIQTVIDSASAPHEFTYPLDLPEGAVLSMTADGGVVATAPGGDFLLGIRPPWAKDAEGRDVPTSYRLDGDSLVQSVASPDSAQYPMVADPWLGIALIDKVSKAWISGKGYRYSVFPTWWGRGGAGALARWAAWSEAKSKGGIPQTATLENQFLCHYDYRPLTTFKSSWNLEAYARDKGYLSFMASQCN
ncbi:DUF2599 domain-containing protein [Leifsonia sp. F6_8S_P_1B]|uniref:DUF2599 domain-containing protein n=1 Tax=Leifsonia williamsii TaxID=3035919 RepID=A0ABT8K9K9_9MICO|nr:DUF2599 domain-containing protein [Leifsonia williamsii]MDN4614151.1 DUF2599 domain-containing protein [Leifsonia williamsii]